MEAEQLFGEFFPQAVAWGVPPADFWQLTPREINGITSAFAIREKENAHRQAVLLYNTVILISIAFHNPKKMPAFEKAFPGLMPERQPQNWQTAKKRIEDYRDKMESLQQRREGGTL